MQLPWRAAEAMHWQLGETDMARRAGVVPFSLANPQQDSSRSSPSRGHAHSHSQGSLSRGEPHLLSRYPRGAATHLPHHQPQHSVPPPHPLAIPPPIPTIPPPGPGRGTMAPRRESMPPRPTPPSEYLYETPSAAPGPGLPPIQPGRDRGGSGGMQLPSVAELTTGVSPYSTPAYSLGGVSASPSATASPRAALVQVPPPPSLSYSPDGASSSKRGRSSPDSGREATRRRH